jgi:hypothetical protein
MQFTLPGLKIVIAKNFLKKMNQLQPQAGESIHNPDTNVFSASLRLATIPVQKTNHSMYPAAQTIMRVGPSGFPPFVCPLLSEHFLHPYRIEFLALFLPDFSEPAAFNEPVPLMEFDTAGIERRYAGQDIRYSFSNCTLFKRIEQHLPKSLSGVVRM